MRPVRTGRVDFAANQCSAWNSTNRDRLFLRFPTLYDPALGLLDTTRYPQAFRYQEPFSLQPQTGRRSIRLTLQRGRAARSPVSRTLASGQLGSEIKNIYHRDYLELLTSEA